VADEREGNAHPRYDLVHIYLLVSLVFLTELGEPLVVPFVVQLLLPLQELLLAVFTIAGSALPCGAGLILSWHQAL
jgi:hypothetical protein